MSLNFLLEKKIFELFKFEKKNLMCFSQVKFCLKLRKSFSNVSVRLNFVKIYALKGLGIKPYRESKRLETELGKLSKTFTHSAEILSPVDSCQSLSTMLEVLA